MRVQKAGSDAIRGIAAVLGWLARAEADDAALRRLQALLVPALVAVPALQFREMDVDANGGRGRIFSYVVYHRVYHPAFAQEVPYAVAVIELDEGPRMYQQCDRHRARQARLRHEGRGRLRANHRGDHATEVQACGRVSGKKEINGQSPMTAGALDGIRVLEFASYVSGPFAGMLLSDLGAEVVKIEIAGRRRSVPDVGQEDYNGTFGSMNRNKKSVTLDLKTKEGQAAARKLALSADVIIENFRAGAMERLGLGYEASRRRQSKADLLFDHRLWLGGPLSQPSRL